MIKIKHLKEVEKKVIRYFEIKTRFNKEFKDKDLFEMMDLKEQVLELLFDKQG